MACKTPILMARLLSNMLLSHNSANLFWHGWKYLEISGRNANSFGGVIWTGEVKCILFWPQAYLIERERERERERVSEWREGETGREWEDRGSESEREGRREKNQSDLDLRRVSICQVGRQRLCRYKSLPAG